MAPNAPCVCVNIHSMEWELMTFTANINDSVKIISEHISSRTKVPVQDHVLFLGPKTLKPPRRLSSYGIDKEKTIHLSLKVVKSSDEEVPIFLVESGDEGQRQLLQVWRSSSVAQVKEMIDIDHVRPETQTVTCNGKRPEDRKTMADYDVRKGNLLFLAFPSIKG
ncbi:ubiquitin D-like [Tamandua tetradactyla]|uniref:ubiquitin D-like n=1 Tax=Tamandua tetradactyla TaxID=48850 RepID=UPI004054956E